MKIRGVVSNIIFYNAENGYSVLQVQTDTLGEITVVGNLPLVSEGESIEAEGEQTQHSRYGMQFTVKTLHILTPETPEGIERYLASGLIEGVGAVTAKNIVKVFGKDALKVIENDPARLEEVRGISAARAIKISNAYAEHKKMQNTIMFLQEYQLPLSLGIKIYHAYHEDTRRILTENPFRLIDDVDGIGFLTADRIAQRMGIAKNSLFRVRAGIVYALRETGEKAGNTYVYYDDLKQKTHDLLRLEMAALEESFDAVLDSLQLEGSVNLFERDQRPCVALGRFYYTERGVAARIVRLQNEVRPVSVSPDEMIDEYSRVNGIQLHERQRDAIRNAVLQGVTVITGGPGTGKTTIIRGISYLFDALGFRTEFCSPTGRASKRMTEAVGKEAKTIHRLLGSDMAGGKVNFAYNEYHPLNADAVIVDELSMVDISVMFSLLKALRTGCRLVLVGDKDQLPSVGAGNVLADIIRSGIVPVTYLTQIYRQSQDSLIVSNAHLINECKMPVIQNNSKDFFFVARSSAEETAEAVVQLVCRRLPDFTHAAPKDIQVLAPLKAGASGVEALNTLLQAAINPPARGKPEFTSGNRTFRLFDKVMQTVNDYELNWDRYEKGLWAESGCGVFNGDIGFISAVDRLEHLVEITFEDGRVASYNATDMNNVLLAYAITIHKSQGSEFDVAVIPLVGGPPNILNKNLLYTAVTRAKKTVVLVGSKKNLAMMVHNNYIVNRNTLLCDFLHEETEKYQILFGTEQEEE